MSQPLSDKAQRALAERRERYVQALKERNAELADAVSRDDTDAAKHIAHRLAGSAGLYSLPDLATAASRLDDQLKRTPNLVTGKEALDRLFEALAGATND